jgi:PAS domain S-box-containing protein
VGNPTRLIGVNRSIADQKQAEQALQSSNQRAIAILESMTDAFFTLDQNWQFTYLNPQAEMLLNRAASELLGKNVWTEFPEAIDSPFYQQYNRAVTEQVAVQFEAYYPPLENWFEVHAYPTPAGLGVYFQNVTERRQIQERLQQRERQLQAILDYSPAAIYLKDTHFDRPNVQPLAIKGGWGWGWQSSGNWLKCRVEGYRQQVAVKGWEQRLPCSFHFPVRPSDRFLNLALRSPCCPTMFLLSMPTHTQDAETEQVLSGLHILVVDDEPDACDMMAMLLEPYGATVTTARSAADARMQFRQRIPDVLISDIGMPEENGFMLIRQIRSMEQQYGGAMPAIALSAYVREEDQRQALQAGFQSHLSKPVDGMALVALVAQLTGRSFSETDQGDRFALPMNPG